MFLCDICCEHSKNKITCIRCKKSICGRCDSRLVIKKCPYCRFEKERPSIPELVGANYVDNIFDGQIDPDDRLGDWCDYPDEDLLIVEECYQYV